MRFFSNADSNPRTLVKSRGSDLVVSSAQFKRGDAGNVEFQLFTGLQGNSTPYRISETFELHFLGKGVDDYSDNADAVILETNFQWKPIEQLYAGEPSFNTLQLTAMFCGAIGGSRYGTGYALATTDASRWVTIDSAATVNLSATSPSAFASGSKVWIIAASGTVTLVKPEGVEITDTRGLGLNIAQGSIVQLRRVNATTWELTNPGIGTLKEVKLMGEFTWRALSAPEKWTSTVTFEIVVVNDVDKGNSGAPIDAGKVHDFITHAELSSSLLRTDIAQEISAEAQAQVRENIGAPGFAEVVTTTDQDLTAPQQAQARENIDAASQEQVDNIDDDLAEAEADIADLQTAVASKASSASVTALTATVAAKAAAGDLTALAALVTALTSNALKLTGQAALTEPEKAIFRGHIGAAANSLGTARMAARFNAVPNSANPTLDGALDVVTGTATARPVALAFPGYAFTAPALSPDTIQCPGHPFSNGTPVMVESTGALPAPLLPWTWYYWRDSTSGAGKLAATAGGAVIDLTTSGSGTMKIARAAATIFPQMRRRGHVSAATAGQSCGTRHNSLAWAVSSNAVCGRWTYTVRFGVSDDAAVANARLFVGLVNSTGTLPNANPSALVNMLGIGADTGDANLSIMHNDASGSATKVGLGAGFPANTLSLDMYELQLVCANDGLSVAYTVKNLCTNNTATGTINTNLPANNSMLAHYVWRNNGTTALKVGIDVVQWSIETAF